LHSFHDSSEINSLARSTGAPRTEQLARSSEALTLARSLGPAKVFARTGEGVHQTLARIGWKGGGIKVIGTERCNTLEDRFVRI